MKDYQVEEEECLLESSLMEALSMDDPGERYQAIRKIRNLLIGMECKKSIFVRMGIIEKLLKLMIEEHTTVEFAVEATVILGSIARGKEENLRRILDSHTIRILCKGVCHSDDRLVLACLRSLRICFMTGKVPSDVIYEDIDLVSKLIYLLSRSSQTAEYTANILQKSCKRLCDQTVLYNANVISALIPWLNHKQISVVIPILGCLSALVDENEVIANEFLEGSFDGVSLKDQLVKLISSDKNEEVQVQAANCLTKALRASGTQHSTILQKKILNVFSRMCQKDRPNKIKIQASCGLACLIEDDKELQSTATISNHLVKNITFYFKPSDHVDKETSENLKEGAFKVFAALTANDEKTRKLVVDECSPTLLENIHEAISQERNIPLQIAAFQFVLSLSRSVHQLRTTFQDSKIWQSVITALKSSCSDDIVSVSSSVLCNLLLEFSPCKGALIDSGALDVLVALMKRNELPLKVNGAWGLKNVTYEAKDSLKHRILDVVGIENILNLVTPEHEDIAAKALGVMTNLFTKKEQDIDHLINEHGQEILETIKPLIENDNIGDQLKEEVLCLISNIANGNSAKDILMRDDVLIRRIIGHISSDNEELQIASVFCITNLLREGSSADDPCERQHKLREMGAEKQLQTLLTTTNSNLFDRVKQALQRFT